VNKPEPTEPAHNEPAHNEPAHNEPAHNEPARNEPQPNELYLQIFSCGGTIDKLYFDAKSEYEVGDPQVLTIFQEANVTFRYSIQSLMQKDSLEMNDEDRHFVRQTVEKCPWRLILITHGTDKMPDTARALLGIPGKTIVLTGSMTPARFQRSDAEFNIGCAVGAVMCSPPGVYVAMNGRVFPADRVRKNRDKARFELVD
jgi:L-asparaginase